MSTCAGRTVYCQLLARAIAWIVGTPAAPLEAQHCRLCDGWHVARRPMQADDTSAAPM